VQNVLSFSLSVTPLAFVGHLNDAVSLSGVVLASSVFNIAGFSIVCGLSAGSETLCGQAFGAGQYRVLGAVAVRAFSVCLAACFPVWLLWSRAIGPVLLYFGQRPEVVKVAALYLKQVRPALFFAALSEVLKRYLLAQRVVLPGVLAMAATTALAPLYCYTLIFGLERGAEGAGPAFVLSTATGALLLLAYVAWRDLRAARRNAPDATLVFGSLSEALRAAFTGWPSYLSFAIPALVQMSAEWWFYEVAILIAGAGEHGDVEGGAAGLCFQVSALVFMSAMALGSSVNTRVAHALGGGMPRSAKRAAVVAIAMTLAMQGALVGAMLALREPLLGAFTNSRVVKQAASAAWLPLAASILSDAANCMFSGVLRGAGRQTLGAICNICGYWAVGMPLCFWLGRRYELWGLWSAIALTSTGVAVVQGVVVWRLDWQAEVRRAAALSADQARATAAAEAEAVVDAGGGGGTAAYSGLRAVEEDEDDEDEEGGRRQRRDQQRRPAPAKAPPSLAAAPSKELPLTLHAPASRMPSAFSVESGNGGSFTAAAGAR
jgi:MATE family multidrug resistance protein